MNRIESLQLPGTALDIPLQAVYRYLGLRGTAPDEVLAALTEKSIREFQDVARLSACYLISPCRETEQGVELGVFLAPGESVARNLRGCDHAILFAATTGVETERQRRRAELSSMAQALILDAIGSAAIECFCDWLSEEWRRMARCWRLSPRR